MLLVWFPDSSAFRFRGGRGGRARESVDWTTGLDYCSGPTWRRCALDLCDNGVPSRSLVTWLLSLGTRLFAHGGIVWKTAHIRVVLTPRICKPQRFHKRHVNSKALSKLHARSILNALESTCRIWSRCGSYLLIMHPFWGARRTTLVWAVFQTLPPCAKSLVPRLLATSRERKECYPQVK